MTGTFGAVGARETHISQLFFTEDRVYKLLKPITNAFLDFADQEERIVAAQAESDLNARISPDVYLGTADIIEQGVIADRMIVMRRLPADRQLDGLVTAADFVDRVRDVARFVAAFHSRQEPIRGAAASMAEAESVARNWSDNLGPIRAAVGPILYAGDFDEIVVLAEAYLAGRQQLFADRIAQGWVRDGHGDLRCEHVFCLDDGPRVIDCLAFRDDYRIADVLADIGFLAMDLHRLAGPEAAATLITAYDQFTNEHHPASLAHHYVAYRAHVRAKIACMRLAQGDRTAVGEIQTYHQLALQHLRHGRVRLVLVGGGAGVGKSTVAAGLGQHMGAAVLRSDEIRKELASMSHDDHAFAEPGADLYRQEFTDAVYAEMLREAEALLCRGESVVLDASWADEDRRKLARDLGDRTSANLVELRCELDPALAKERIARRLSSLHNPSDATPDVADYIMANFDPWPAAVSIRTEQRAEDAIEEAHRSVFARSAPAGPRPSGKVTIDLSVLAESCFGAAPIGRYR